MELEMKPGARFRSAVCETEMAVVKAPGEPIDLRCGGHPVLPITAERPSGLSPEAGFDEGTVLGKRYTTEAGTLEVLCTKAGPGSLSVADVLLHLKDAKPLPSSD
jgi:hypothetical protein